MRPSVCQSVLITSAILGLAFTLVRAGDLTPPAGPVAETMKTLQQVEPRTPLNLDNTPGDADSVFKITQPGSYYLTGHLDIPTAKSGIEIVISNVTIDLMGFTVRGVEPNTLHGIATGPIQGLRNIEVRNGVIDSVGKYGVSLGSFNNRVENLRVNRCSETGIFGGNRTVISGCVVENNGFEGISTMSNSVIIDCTASGNSINGIVAGFGNTVTNCSAFGNASNGISIDSGSTISNSSSSFNNGSGIVATIGATITACTAYFNDNDGIVASQATISNCTVNRNRADGIQVANSSTVRDNTCDQNGYLLVDGAGIFVTGSGNRIQDNLVNRADRGIDVDGVANLILGNHAHGNTVNYDFVASNRYGAIVDLTTPGTDAVLGDGWITAIPSTDPWANFSF